jgi:hypothetical protein
MHDESDAPSANQPLEGGEWQLLRGRLNQWLATVDAAALWQGLQTPLRAAGLLLAGLVLLKVYGAILETIAAVPTLSGWLELVGLVWLVRFSMGHLLHREDRDRTLAALTTRWRGFLGRS